MTQDDVQRVLDAATALDPMAAAVLRLAAVTGARRSELAALRWTDLVGSELVIDSSLTVVTQEVEGERRTIVRDDPTKGGEVRQLALDPETVALLEALRDQREALGPWMFGDSIDPPRPDRIGYWWRCAREAAGIDLSWRLHDLRHWSATWAIGAGYDLATVAGRLGHSDASTTLRVYAHAQTNRDSDLAVRLGQALRSGPLSTDT
jgi:integrase